MYIIQTYQNEAIQDRHDVAQVSRIGFKRIRKIRPVDNRKNIKEYFAVGPECNGSSLVVHHHHIIKRDHHFADVLIHP